MSNEQNTEELVAFFQALADVTRLKLVGLLAQGERSVDELATALSIRQPTVSHHLSKLRMLKIVRLRKEGQTHYYQLDEGVIQEMARRILSVEGLARLAPEGGADAWEQKVLEHFFDGEGRLKEIPTQRRKRDVILRRLVREFEPGRRYTEREVNEVLRRFHDDVSTLRREFIMTHLMDREVRQGQESLYWRIDGED